MRFTATTVRRACLGAVPIIMVMLGYGEVFMSQANAAAGVKNVLLIHGGFVDGSGWQGVYDLLKKDGYHVTIVQNPTTTLADDVAMTKRMLAAQDGPAILVGHSYGGVVITESGTDPKVAGLVYIAAFAPDKGESVSSLIKNPPPGAAGPPILPPQDGFLFLDRAKFRAAFAADVSPEEVEAQLVPRLDRRQDDSARCAARHVKACRVDRRRGERQPRRLRLAAEGCCLADREGCQRCSCGHAVVGTN